MKVVHTIVLFAALTGAVTCLFVKSSFLVPGPYNWTDAETYCRRNYVDLLSINAKVDDITSLVPPFSAVISWIGLSKKKEEKSFTQWSDRSPLGYTNWASGEPDRPETQHCVAIFNNAWQDQPCQQIFPLYCFSWEPQVIVVQEMKTWEEALQHCRTFYTDLISLATETDKFAVNKYTENVQTPMFWTGLRFLDGSWFWVNKVKFRNLFSLPSCPAPLLRCGARRTGDDVFENRDCEEKMNFICYKSGSQNSQM